MSYSHPVFFFLPFSWRRAEEVRGGGAGGERRCWVPGGFAQTHARAPAGRSLVAGARDPPAVRAGGLTAAVRRAARLQRPTATRRKEGGGAGGG
jgi:hypothetical protein